MTCVGVKLSKQWLYHLSLFARKTSWGVLPCAGETCLALESYRGGIGVGSAGWRGTENKKNGPFQKYRQLFAMGISQTNSLCFNVQTRIVRNEREAQNARERQHSKGSKPKMRNTTAGSR